MKIIKPNWKELFWGVVGGRLHASADDKNSLILSGAPPVYHQDVEGFHWTERLVKIAEQIILFLLGAILLTSSALPPGDETERVRAFTRMREFDFVTWTLDALYLKDAQLAAIPELFLSPTRQKQTVMDYLQLVNEINVFNAEIEKIYADPNISDPKTASSAQFQKYQELQKERERLAPLCESILQDQTTEAIARLGLSVGGQALPPVLYHVSALPKALIVSPRNEIRQEQFHTLVPDLNIQDMVALEQNVEKTMDVSALVEDVGGIGTYPTMVMSSTDLSWLLEVIAHEWTHNYLTMRPLGMSYDVSPELRTINETTASIAGKEISQWALEKYYPELVPAPAPAEPAEQEPASNEPAQESQPPVFSFQKEMHTTRVKVDQMLAEGKITEAEQYMEERRRFMWDNGYQIRRLNQAYFAFHGAYADTPGGAAGSDPVGPAVRALRAKSANLADFLNRISWITSFDGLKAAVSQ